VAVSARRRDTGAMRHAAARIRTRVHNEDGIALVMAVLIMAVLTVTFTALIFMTSASSRHASSTNAGDQAYSLAEAGLNNAISVLEANYPGSATYPGNTGLLPSRSTVYGTGSCTPPANNCVTWSGAVSGPLIGSPWRYQWTITSTGTVQNPTGPGAAPITRMATAIVPIVVADTVPTGPASPLNFLYAGANMSFENSVHVKAQVYVTNDLHLDNTSVIDGAAQKVAVGHDLYLNGPQNQIGLTGGSDPRIAEIHVVHQCSSKANPTLHTCGPLQAQWDTDKIFAPAGAADNAIPLGFLAYTPQLTCCALPSPTTPASNLGYAYVNAELGPYSPCTVTSGTPPIFDTASGTPDNAVNMSATPTTAINLTPAASYTCQSWGGGSKLAELSWNATTCVLTIQQTIFIDGSIYILPPNSCPVSNTARYTGQGTIYASGTFGMKNASICATHTGYTGACDYTGTSPWNPNLSALVIVADGAAGGCCAQGQGSDFNTGDGIEIKNANFQGVLIAANGIRVETTSKVQGPMISVYKDVWAGESNDIIFPPVLFAPAGGGGPVAPPPLPKLLPPQNYSGG
jgi:hypothetical protein